MLPTALQYSSFTERSSRSCSSFTTGVSRSMLASVAAPRKELLLFKHASFTTLKTAIRRRASEQGRSRRMLTHEDDGQALSLWLLAGAGRRAAPPRAPRAPGPPSARARARPRRRPRAARPESAPRPRASAPRPGRPTRSPARRRRTCSRSSKAVAARSIATKRRIWSTRTCLGMPTASVATSSHVHALLDEEAADREVAEPGGQEARYHVVRGVDDRLHVVVERKVLSSTGTPVLSLNALRTPQKCGDEPRATSGRGPCRPRASSPRGRSACPLGPSARRS